MGFFSELGDVFSKPKRNQLAERLAIRGIRDTQELQEAHVTFGDVLKDGVNYDVAKLKHGADQFVGSAEHMFLQGKGEEFVKEYKEVISEIRAAAIDFKGVENALKHENKASAIAQIKQAMAEIEGFLGKDLMAITFAVGVEADLGVGVNASICYAAGLPNIEDGGWYGTVGVTGGAEEGANMQLVIGLSTQPATKQEGAFIDISVEVDMALGGGIAVSFLNPQDIVVGGPVQFGGVTMAVEAGEELQLAVGGGYTHAI